MNILVQILKKLNVIPVPLADVQLSMCLARCLMEANRLGVFTALEVKNQGLTSDELAEQIGISSEGAGVLLMALHKSGYLAIRNGRYLNGRWVKRWITDPKRGIPNVLRLQIHGWSRLSDLETPLRTGRPAKDYHALEASASSERQELYTLAMREMARLFIPHFIRLVKLPKNAKRILDIGGAHGDYCRALMRKFPSLKATVLDLAGPITTARRLHTEEDGPEDIEFRVGDALKDELGENWDAVLLINFVHVFNSDQNRELFSRIHESLNPNGVVLIMDQFLGIGRLQDTVAGVISLNYFTVGGRAYHLEEMKGLLRDAGFNRIRVQSLLFKSSTALFQGWKSE